MFCYTLCILICTYTKACCLVYASLIFPAQLASVDAAGTDVVGTGNALGMLYIALLYMHLSTYSYASNRFLGLACHSSVIPLSLVKDAWRLASEPDAPYHLIYMPTCTRMASAVSSGPFCADQISV